MSGAARFVHWIGNKLYYATFPLYRPLYAAFKAVTDRQEHRLVAHHLRYGDVVVDAGANIGVYSQFLAKRVGSTGVVHSFEPSPENFQRLSDALTNTPNVCLNQLALSDRTGDSLLYVSERLNVDHRSYPTDDDPRATISIRSTTLDDYFLPGARVNFIKMDIQGYELHALRGAKRVLADNPDIKLLLEVWPFGLKQAGDSAADLFTFLRQMGFDIRLVTSRHRLADDFLIKIPQGEDNYFNVLVTKADPDEAKSFRTR